MDDQQIIDLIKIIIEKQGKTLTDITPATTLNDLDFRSLDFSELCVRVEQELDKELQFDISRINRIETVEDICSFLVAAQNAS